MSTRKAYPSEVSDVEWVFVAPYLTLLPEDAGQRRYELREVFRGLQQLALFDQERRAMALDSA